MTEFYGYERPDGSVGIRNHFLVMAPIDCSYEPAKKIASRVKNAVAITQHHGCNLDEMVANTLIGIGRNPNVAGILLVGLGCESLNSELIAEGVEPTGKPIETLVIQEEGGTLNTIKEGIRILNGMTEEATAIKREPFPISKLIVGVECGGSDATSGLSSNPAMGVTADKLIDLGGTVIFSETQEMIGTQEVLTRRAVNVDVANSIRKIISRQEKRMKSMGIDSRFMPKGNVDGGLTTIEEKSLGAIRKGGTRQIEGVLENSWRTLESPSHSGLWIQDGTGHDVPSVTHMVAAGAQVIAFTTGRGSTTGHAVAPVIKITGNPSTYEKLNDDMDINAGTILSGAESLNAVGERIFTTIVEVASGVKTKSEDLGYKDFIVFRRNLAQEQLLGFLCQKGG